eukprot:3538584-Pleurochrysis_carterae.AAC.2
MAPVTAQVKAYSTSQQSKDRDFLRNRGSQNVREQRTCHRNPKADHQLTFERWPPPPHPLLSALQLLRLAFLPVLADTATSAAILRRLPEPSEDSQTRPHSRMGIRK